MVSPSERRRISFVLAATLTLATLVPTVPAAAAGQSAPVAAEGVLSHLWDWLTAWMGSSVVPVTCRGMSTDPDVRCVQSATAPVMPVVCVGSATDPNGNCVR